MRKLQLLIVFLISFGIAGAQTEFAWLTDIHVSPGNANEKALARIVDEINVSKPPFVIITGDLTNQGSNAELAAVKRQFDRFTMPYYVIPGNHETTWSQSAVKEYYRLFGSDRFFFRKGNLLFIGYNSGPYMKMGDGHIKHEDLLWIDKTLAAERHPGDKVYSFAHYPFTEGDLGNWREIVSLLKKYRAVVSFCGHGHAYRDMAFGDLKGIMARSTFLGNDTTAGYSWVKLTPDSVFVNEKIVGGETRRRFAFATDASSKMAPVPVVKNDLPRNVKLTLLVQDEASVFTGVAVDAKSVYYGNSLGTLKAVSKRTAKTVWSKSTGYSLYSTPVCSDGKVMEAATDNSVYAFAAADGKLCWQVTGTDPFVADGVVADSKLYQGGYEKFYRIDVTTGKTEWVFGGIGNYCQAAPAVSNGHVVFGAWDTYLYCLDAQTGKLCWKWNNGKNQNLYSPGNCVPVVHDGTVVITAPDRYITAIDLASGKQLWRSNTYQVRESQGISQNGNTVYAKLMNGQLLAASSQRDTFRPLWTVDAGLGYEHAPCPILEYAGVVYLGSRNGVVVAVDAVSRKVLWSYKCGNSEINRFAVDSTGDIFFSLVEGKIYRIQIKK
jgi:outer membrane protein assembly factor BamB